MPAAGWAQAKTNYSGTWTFDQANSDPPPARSGRGGARGGGGGVPASLTITQTASQITIDRAMPAGPTAPGATTSAVYKLDGSESTNALGDVFLSRSKVSWDGANLVIATSKDMGLGPNGHMSEDVKEVYASRFAIRRHPEVLSDLSDKEILKMPGVGPASLCVVREYLDSGESPTVERIVGGRGTLREIEARARRSRMSSPIFRYIRVAATSPTRSRCWQRAA